MADIVSLFTLALSAWFLTIVNPRLQAAQRRLGEGVASSSRDDTTLCACISAKVADVQPPAAAHIRSMGVESGAHDNHVCGGASTVGILAEMV